MDIGQMGILGSLVGLALLALVLWLSVRILNKAGYSGWWSLTLLIPVVGFVMLWVFAFADWPVYRNKPRPAMTAEEQA